MLSVKKLATRILRRLNLRVVQVTASSATSVGANGGTAWVTVPFPTDGTPLCVVGYYLGGGAACSVYNLGLATGGGRFALRNNASAAQNVTITASYLVID